MIRQSNENNCQRYSSPQKNIQERYFKNKMQLNHCVGTLKLTEIYRFTLSRIEANRF